MSASVLIAGVTDTPVEIETIPDSLVEDVIAQAASMLNVDPVAADRLVPIVNGRTADKSEVVPENAVITVSPLVSNG